MQSSQRVAWPPIPLAGDGELCPVFDGPRSAIVSPVSRGKMSVVVIACLGGALDSPRQRTVDLQSLHKWRWSNGM